MWNYFQPIKFLPVEISCCFLEEADFLYRDLLENKLIVKLRPAYEERYNGHMIRIVESRNPDWYRDLYSSTAHLKRKRCERSLDRICQNTDLPYFTRRGAVSPFGSYDTLFRELIPERLTKGYDLERRFIPENLRVAELFQKLI